MGKLVEIDDRELVAVGKSFQKTSADLARNSELFAAGGADRRVARMAARKTVAASRAQVRQRATVGAPGKRLKRKAAYSVRYGALRGKPEMIQVKAGIFGKNYSNLYEKPVRTGLAYEVGWYSNYVHQGTKFRKTTYGEPRGMVVGNPWLRRQQEPIGKILAKAYATQLPLVAEHLAAKEIANAKKKVG